MKISKVHAREILDSRGNPTIEVDVFLEDSSMGRASAPSGASTGIHEALELRDGDKSRYEGKGVLKAVKNVNETINNLLTGKDADDQKTIDEAMLTTDGTPNKANLGANAILATSIAVSKAAATANKMPLWKWLRIISETDEEPDFPIPMFNVMNGGLHAENEIKIQEFMIVPQNIDGIDRKIEAGVKINNALGEVLMSKGLDVSIGDEGGYAPSQEKALNDDEDVLELLMEAIEKAGYKPGEEIMLALDVAISRFYDLNTKNYDFPHQREGSINGPAAKIAAYFEELTVKYPFVSIEDPLHEDDWDGWVLMSGTLMAQNVLCVGDDFIVTNPVRLQKAIDMNAISAVIVKPNQVGTLTEVFKVLKLCEENMITPIISHRSGDTADSFISHLGYGTSAKYMKSGDVVRAERLEKYNELLRIKDDIGQ